jgi:hypothetical protein
LSVTGAGSIQGLTVGRGASAVSSNTAVGASALAANTTGGANVALGLEALLSNTTGSSNTAVGRAALRTSTTVSANTAVGLDAGRDTTGADNAILGWSAMRFNSSGASNTAIGSAALFSNTTASFNTAVGYQAGYGTTTGEGNTILGYQAGYNVTTSNYNVFLGMNAGNSATGAEGRNTFVGMNAGQLITTGIRNTIVGRFNGNEDSLDIRTSSGYVVLADGSGNRQLSMYEGGTVALDNAAPVAGTGITFPATQSASSNANTLDDYEEGTWTPNVYHSGSNNASWSVVEGRYTKIGRVVYFWFTLDGGSSGTSGSALLVTLPQAFGTNVNWQNIGQTNSSGGNYAVVAQGTSASIAQIWSGGGQVFGGVTFITGSGMFIV